MKRNKILVVTLAILLFFITIITAACNQNLPWAPRPPVSGTPNPEIELPQIGEFVVFDESRADDVIIENLTIPTMTLLVIGNTKLFENEYSYSNGTLTISGERLAGFNTTFTRQMTIYYETSGTELTYLYSLPMKLHFATKVIMNIFDFNDIRNNMDSSTYYVLGADINFYGKAEPFTPIGQVSNKSEVYLNDAAVMLNYEEQGFNGIFEGAGHKLYNIYINPDYSTNPAHKYYDLVDKRESPFCGGGGMALFSFVGTSGVLRNFSVENAEINGSQISAPVVGVLKGDSFGGGKIQNVIVGSDVVVKGNWTPMDFNCFTAGFVGMIGANARVENCITSAKVEMGEKQGHELSRAFAGKNWGIINNCFALDQGISYINVGDIATGRTIEVIAAPSADFPSGEKLTGSDCKGIAGWVNSPYTLDSCAFILASESDGFFYNNWNPTKDVISADSIVNYGNTVGALDDGTPGISGFKTDTELKSASLYADYSLDNWIIVDGQMPKLKIIYGNGYVA